MKYAVDQIIDGIAVLENLETKEKKEIGISELPHNTKEGSILIEEKVYKIDSKEEDKRRKMLRNKLERLKGKNE